MAVIIKMAAPALAVPKLSSVALGVPTLSFEAKPGYGFGPYGEGAYGSIPTLGLSVPKLSNVKLIV